MIYRYSPNKWCQNGEEEEEEEPKHTVPVVNGRERESERMQLEKNYIIYGLVVIFIVYDFHIIPVVFVSVSARALSLRGAFCWMFLFKPKKVCRTNLLTVSEWVSEWGWRGMHSGPEFHRVGRQSWNSCHHIEPIEMKRIKQWSVSSHTHTCRSHKPSHQHIIIASGPWQQKDAHVNGRERKKSEMKNEIMNFKFNACSFSVRGIHGQVIFIGMLDWLMCWARYDASHYTQVQLDHLHSKQHNKFYFYLGEIQRKCIQHKHTRSTWRLKA